MVEVIQGEIFPGDRVVVRGGHELSSLFFLGVLRLSAQEQQRLGIRTEAAGYRDVSKTLQLPAVVTLPPENRSVLTTQLNGTVQSHSLSPGRSVKKGDKLMEITSPEFYKLQLDLISTSLDSDLSRRRADRLESVKGDAVSMRLVLETRAQAEQLEIRAQSLRRQLATLSLSDSEIDSIANQRRILDYLPIRANISGRIATSVVTLGETVTANQPLVEIQDLQSFWIEAQVPSREVASMSVDAVGVASLLADSEVRLPVVLSRIGPTLSESTRTQRIWFTPKTPRVDDSNIPQFSSGALMTVGLPVGTKSSRLAIPASAILRDGLHLFSFVRKNDGNMERRRVTIGQTDGQYTEIVSGIEAGESVVTVGSRELQTAFASLR
jgi:RND family efflux transporter MFP subunit